MTGPSRVEGWEMLLCCKYLLIPLLSRWKNKMLSIGLNWIKMDRWMLIFGVIQLFPVHGPRPRMAFDWREDSGWEDPLDIFLSLASF